MAWMRSGVRSPSAPLLEVSNLSPRRLQQDVSSAFLAGSSRSLPTRAQTCSRSTRREPPGRRGRRIPPSSPFSDSVVIRLPCCWNMGLCAAAARKLHFGLQHAPLRLCRRRRRGGTDGLVLARMCGAGPATGGDGARRAGRHRSGPDEERAHEGRHDHRSVDRRNELRLRHFWLRQLRIGGGHAVVDAGCERAADQYVLDRVDRRRVLSMLRRRQPERDAVPRHRVGQVPVRGAGRLRERVLVVVLRGPECPPGWLVR